MDWVNLPEGPRLMRNKVPEYEEKHEFKFKNSTHTGPGVRFIMTCAGFEDLEELGDNEAWSQVRHFWQQVYGNGLWHPAYEDHKSPRMRTAGVYALYTRYVRGMLGPEAAAIAMALAKDDRWDFQLLDGMTFYVNLVHKQGQDKQGNEKTYVNLAPFPEGSDCFDFERLNALCAMSRDHIDENVKVLDANIERLGGVSKGKLAEKYLKTVLLPMIQKLNYWDSEGVAQEGVVMWSSGQRVDKWSLIAESRKRGGRFGDMSWADQVMFLSELARAVAYFGREVPDPPKELGGDNLWYTDEAVDAPVWEGYSQPPKV